MHTCTCENMHAHTLTHLCEHNCTQEDALEYDEPRMFWPREIWSKYSGDLQDFKAASKRKEAVQCLNHMVRWTSTEQEFVCFKPFSGIQLTLLSLSLIPCCAHTNSSPHKPLHFAATLICKVYAKHTGSQTLNFL